MRTSSLEEAYSTCQVVRQFRQGRSTILRRNRVSLKKGQSSCTARSCLPKIALNGTSKSVLSATHVKPCRSISTLFVNEHLQ